MQEEKPSNLKTVFVWLMKLLGIALAVWLVRRTLANADADLGRALAGAWKLPLVVAVLAYGVVNLVAAWRWRLLLLVQGICIPLYDMFRLTLIGVFFSNIIPGSVSGDLVKIAYLMRYAGNKKAEAVLTIAVDRLIGLGGLFLVAIVSTLFLLAEYPRLFTAGGVLVYAIWAVCGGGVALLLAMLLLVLREPILRVRPVAALVRWLGRMLPTKLCELIARLTTAVDLYRTHPGAVMKVLLASACIHTLLAGMNYLLGKSFHETVMTPLQYVITTQLGNVTGLIPLTPGGMGIRDAVTSYFLSSFNASPQEAMALIPVSYSLIMVFWALVGAVFMVTHRNGG